MQHKRLPDTPDAIAPDGSAVRLLVSCQGGSMAHFSLASRQTSVAIAHRTIEEMWFFVGGQGEMWRRTEGADDETVITVATGEAITIPSSTHFQFRSSGSEPLAAVGATVPAWPGVGDLSGRGEAYLVPGPWTATVDPGVEL